MWGFWPRSLASRTTLVLLLGLALVQAAGLTIHALDRLDLQRLAQVRDVSARIMGLYRQMAAAPPQERDYDLGEGWLPAGYIATVSQNPKTPTLGEAQPGMQRLVLVNLSMVPLPPPLRPREVRIYGGVEEGRVMVSLALPARAWLNVEARIDPPRPWHSPSFLYAFAAMTMAAVLLSLWAVRRLTEPVCTLAAAAEALGRDVNAAPLPERGPSEVATAAAAFNLMADRIRRFVQDRTELLTAIGHDLRTPITRLKLRVEFVDDDEQRRKMLADLDDLEAMVSATLAFGRDAATSEPVTSLDLAELLRTIVDETADANPGKADLVTYDGPAHLTITARLLSLKRALANLINNAMAYGGSAHVNLLPAERGTEPRMLTIEIADDGPGIPADQLDRVFEPFTRLETSRNRETGGTGLGLSIARNIFRAHGGDVVLTNRRADGQAGGGAKAIVTLPA